MKDKMKLISVLLLLGSCASYFETKDYKNLQEKCTQRDLDKVDVKSCENLLKIDQGSFDKLDTNAQDKAANRMYVHSFYMNAHNCLKSLDHLTEISKSGAKIIQKDFDEFEYFCSNSVTSSISSENSGLLKTAKYHAADLCKILGKSKPDICLFEPHIAFKLKDYDEAKKKYHKLCKSGIQKACEEKNVVENYLAALKWKEEQANRIEKEKLSAEEEFNRQRSLCKQGDTNICWSLFVANKENQHGYEYLRDACILGHAQACQTKLIIDEETSRKNAEKNEEIRERKEKQQEFSKSMRCSGKNRPHSYDKSCDEECPRYQECLIKVNNLKQEEMLEKSNNRSKNIHCTPDGFGGFRCSEN